MKIELELHDARKELPTESRIYLVNMGRIHTTHYSAKHKLFNAYDGFSDKEAKTTAIPTPDWWAEIPEGMLFFPANDMPHEAQLTEKRENNMENENYIMLNGKKIPLTDEQIHLIQADDDEKSPFDRVEKDNSYYMIIDDLSCVPITDCRTTLDNERFNSANYCADKNIMKQHALHMMLNNLLWRYSMTHGGDEIDWQDMCEAKYRIFYNCRVNDFQVDYSSGTINIGAIYFTDPKTAEAAIEEIVKPFIAEHPDFDVAKM